jgi:hypothetical protein
VESDSLETIEACNGSGRWWSESSAILDDCVDFASSIGSVSYQFCLREANQVADDIARFSFRENTKGLRFNALINKEGYDITRFCF